MVPAYVLLIITMKTKRPLVQMFISMTIESGDQTGVWRHTFVEGPHQIGLTQIHKGLPPQLKPTSLLHTIPAHTTSNILRVRLYTTT
jgi:hypothetical protein